MPIKIVSKKEGFRRCGVAHPSSPKTYADGFFTPEQVKKLKAEAMLVVMDVDEEPEETVEEEEKQKGTEEEEDTSEEGSEEEGTEGTEEEANPDELDYSEMDYWDLQKLAKEKGLDSSGKKADLIKRLEGAE